MEKEFQHIFRTAASYMSLTKLDDSTVIEISDSYLAILGLSRDEVVGKKVFDLNIWENLEDRARIVSELKEGKTVRGRRVRIRGEGGQIRVCLFFANRAEFDGKECLLAEAIDITDIEEARRALAESESKFFNLLENVPLGIQGYSPDGTISYWNKKSEEIYGYSAEEALGKNLGDLIIPQELRPVFEKGVTLSSELKKSGEFLPAGEVTLKRKDGSSVTVYSIHTAVVSEGKPPVLFCIDMDLSERRKMERVMREREELFRAFFELPLAGAAITAPDGGWVAVNDRLCDMLGYEREELLAMTWKSLTPPEDLEKEMLSYETLLSGNQARTLEKRYTRKDGSVIEVEVSAVAVREPDKGTQLFAVLVQDVTERNRADEVLRAKMAEVEKLNRFMMGRETRVIELKREINEFLKDCGKPPRYSV